MGTRCRAGVPLLWLCATGTIACGSRSFLYDALPDGDGGGGGGASAATTSASTPNTTSASSGPTSSVATFGSTGVGTTVGTTTGTGGGAGTGGEGGSAGIGGQPPTEEPFLREGLVRTPPEFDGGGPEPPPVDDALPIVDVSVDVSRRIRPVPRTLFGNNAAVWQGDLLLSDLMLKRLADVNVSLLRFPGGSTSDTYHFDGNYPPYAVEQGWDVMSEDWAVSTAEYMQVVRALGAVPLITVNHGFASYFDTAYDGSVDNAAQLAAAWVEYCNAPNDGSNVNGGIDYAELRAEHGFVEPFGVRYWEVGNETYGSWEAGFQPEGSVYGANFNVMVDAMRAVDPDIFIGLVTPADPEYVGWTEAVLSHPGTFERADFLVVHDYFGWISSESELEPSSMLARTSRVREDKERLSNLVEEVTGSDPADLPMYFGEYNLPLPTHRYQISHISSLFIADVLGQLATSGWAAASLWDITNDYDEGIGLGAGDHGFLSREQPNLPNLTPRPTYFPFFFFSEHYGNWVIQAESERDDVAVYASLWSDDAIGIIAVNKSPDDVTLQLVFTSVGHEYHGNLWYLTADSVDDQLVYLNGNDNGEIAGGPDPTLTEAYSKYFDDESPQVPLPSYSVLSLVLWPE